MTELISDLQKLVRNWKHWPTPLCYVRVLDAKRLLERIKELEAENARLRKAFDLHARGRIVTEHGWFEDNQRTGYTAYSLEQTMTPKPAIGPFRTPLEAVLAAMEQTQEVES